MIRITGKVSSSMEQESLTKSMRNLLVLFTLFLSLNSLAQNVEGILVSDVNVRWSGSSKAKIIKSYPKGTRVLVLQKKGNWTFIENISNNTKGWVSSKFVKTNIGYTTQSANVRSNPKGKVIKTISKGTQVLIMQEQSTWYFIKDLSNNKKGWVHSSLISNTGAVNQKVIENTPKNTVDTKEVVQVTKSNSSDEVIEQRMHKLKVYSKWIQFKKEDRPAIYISNAETFLKTVNSYKGVSYLFGGNSRSGIDCSGLIFRGLKSTGYQGERINAQMYAQSGRLIDSKDALKKGDLVCFTNTTYSKKLVQHIAVYVGNNEFIHAPSSGGIVKLSNINDPYYWGDKFIFGVRLTKI
ncbi:MAG: C40 family peptidase [Flavobacteriales bacterium]|nr:NlpC/P60 family protein [Flavobacteriaceae bacterium]